MKRFLKILKWILLSLAFFILTFFIASELYINQIKNNFSDSAIYDVNTIEVNEVTMAYREYFSDQAKTIVVVHGFLGNSYEYDDFFNQMPEDFNYRVIVFDLIGFGVSDKPIDYTYTSENQANTVLEAIELLEIDDYILMAHSMGGDIAMRMANSDSNINALILLDPVSPSMEVEAISIPRLFYTILFKNYWLQRLGFNSAPYEPLPQETFQASLIQNDSIPSEVLQKFSLDTDELPVIDIVNDIDLPSLLIYGKEDTWTPPEIINEYQLFLTNVESHIIDETGHLIYLENPEILRSLIINFLNNLTES